MKKFLLTIGISAAMLIPATFAQADVIYDWNYSTSAVIKDMQAEGYPNRPLRGIGDEINGGYQEYRWGHYLPEEGLENNSGLRVDGYKDGTIRADGTASSGLLITHFNNPIVEGVVTPTAGVIETTLKLNAGSGIDYTFNSSLSFEFFETPNETEEGFPTLYPNDIFFVTASELMKNVGSFVHDGIEYTVSLYSSIAALEGEYLRMAQEFGGYSADTILYGWTTLEGDTMLNGYELSLVISSSPVPVPGAVWLMGTGLAGIIAMRRRNRA